MVRPTDWDDVGLDPILGPSRGAGVRAVWANPALLGGCGCSGGCSDGATGDCDCGGDCAEGQTGLSQPVGLDPVWPHGRVPGPSRAAGGPWWFGTGDWMTEGFADPWGGGGVDLPGVLIPELPGAPDEGPTAEPMCFAHLAGSAMQPPSLSLLYRETRLCFLQDFGSADVWPANTCCPPVAWTRSCDPIDPTQAGALATFRPYDSSEWGNTYVPLDPGYDTSAAENLYIGALAFLLENMDIVKWVACLTETYSQDLQLTNLAGRIETALTWPGRFHASFIERFLQCAEGNADCNPDGLTEITGDWHQDFEAGDAAGAAFTYWGHQHSRLGDGTVGVKIPLEHQWWQVRVGVYNSATAPDWAKTCVLAFSAGTILHELIHALADGLGAFHAQEFEVPGQWRQPYPMCWDEARMAGSAFLWAISQRYPCVLTPPANPVNDCCGRLDDPVAFLNSGSASNIPELNLWGCPNA